MNHLQTNQKTTHIDPVCGMDISSDNNEFTSTFEANTYYFCKEQCQREFENSPKTYQGKSSFFLKRMWNTYLKRLNKITNGKSQCCH